MCLTVSAKTEFRMIITVRKIFLILVLNFKCKKKETMTNVLKGCRNTDQLCLHWILYLFPSLGEYCLNKNLGLYWQTLLKALWHFTFQFISILAFFSCLHFPLLSYISKPGASGGPLPSNEDMGSKMPNCLRTAMKRMMTTPMANSSMPWIPMTPGWRGWLSSQGQVCVRPGPARELKGDLGQGE